MNETKQVRLQNFDIYVLLFAIPTLFCVMFWSKFFLQNNIQIGSYFQVLLAIYMYRISYNTHSVAVIISGALFLLSSILYSLFTPTKFNESLTYLIVYNNLLFGLYFFPKCDYTDIDLEKFKRSLVLFFLFFVAMYELSSTFASKIVVDEHYNIERNYKEGFIISHHASYYFGVTGFFMFRLGNKWLALFLWIYILTLGARIGIVYIAISIIIILLYKSPSFAKLVYKQRYWILIAIIMTFFAILSYVIDKYGSEVLMVFTTGRSYFQLYALEYINKNGFSIETILGHGPKASNRFNLDVFGAPVWMHNDFLDIFFNIGALGLIVYLKSFINYFKYINALYLFFILFFTAFLNGFMTYDALYIIILSAFFDKRGFLV